MLLKAKLSVAGSLGEVTDSYLKMTKPIIGSLSASNLSRKDQFKLTRVKIGSLLFHSRIFNEQERTIVVLKLQS